MSTKSGSSSRFFLLLFALILLLIAGRYFFQFTQSDTETNSTESLSRTKESQSQISENSNAQATSSTTQEQKSQSQDPVMACTLQLQAKVKSEKIEYEKGTILTSFVSGTTFAEAKTKLSAYGLTVEDETSARNTYSTQRVLTVVVPQGEEITKVCILKQDKAITTATLNVLFDLRF
jgi:cytoskeletal protein RodZ